MTDANSPATFVIFGASGDLTRRKLAPALYANFKKGRLGNCARIVGFARRPYSDQSFGDELRQAVQELHPGLFEPASWVSFAEKLHYVQGDFDRAEDFDRLASGLQRLEDGPANRLYYLATAPEYYTGIITALGRSGLAAQEDGWRRIVIEKPFGRDLETALALDQAVHGVFAEDQIYRIDHYLGKETAQNILFLRFANAIFEPLWNCHYIDHVQITVAESVNVGSRAGYYDSTGVLRDMFQNHLLQLLALIAMEPPAFFQAEAIRNERYKLFQSIRPIALDETVCGQYTGYRHAPGVAPASRTATYAALKLAVDNWRWAGVPFYLRSGKALAAKATEIVVVFKRPPHLAYYLPDKSNLEPNMLSLCIQPDEGVHLRFHVKAPDVIGTVRPVDMEFHYRDSFAGDLPDAYEVLLLDALEGDPSLFTRSDNIRSTWGLIDPILHAWEARDERPLAHYTPGSWGPAQADELIARDGRQWRMGCLDHVRAA